MLALRWQAIGCALILPVCALIIRPHVEAGIIDDFAYIRMVQVYTRTGHLVYNGAESAMVGAMVLVGALAGKLFGFSFTVVRSTVVTAASLTGYLMQRTFVRAGLLNWNASVATLALVLSPLFLPLAFTFMTDVPGLFGVVACLYLTVRAVQATSSAGAVAFVLLAAVVSVAGGTCRQTVWLGVLVLIPSALFLMRRRRNVLLPGMVVVATSLLAVYGLVHWQQQQPYSLREPLLRNHLNGMNLFHFAQGAVRASLESIFLLTPLLIAFVPAVSLNSRRALASVAGLCLCLLGFALVQHHRQRLFLWLGPYLGDWFTPVGAANGMPIHGTREVVLGTAVRLLLTIFMLAGVFCLVVFNLQHPWKKSPPTDAARLSWYQLGWLLVPFTAAYIALLIPRTLYEIIYDRYLLPLLVVALLVLARFYQEQVSPRLPGWSMLTVLLLGAYGVASTHDMFAMFRARQAAIEQMLAQGVAATAIDGAFEYNGLTQIDQTGYVTDRRIRLPASAVAPQAPAAAARLCEPYPWQVLPSLMPRFALSLDPAACAGPAGFAPIEYHPWLGSRTVRIYVVKEPN